MALLVTIVGFVLLGVGASLAQTIRYEPDVVDFGVVAPCKHALDSFELVNESTDSVPTPSMFTINGFYVWFADTTRNIRVGERRRAYVRFIGDASIPIRNQLLAIQFARADGSFVPTRSIRLIGSRAPGPCVRLAIPEITATPGATIDAGVVQDGDFIDFVGTIPEVTFEISWDPTLMVPNRFPIAPIAVGQHRATFRVSLRRQAGHVLPLPFTVTLGNRSEAPIRLEWFSLSDAATPAEGRSGKLVIDGICVDPRLRLFDGASMPIRTFHVYDALGRLVDRLDATSMSDAAARFHHAWSTPLFIVDTLTGDVRSSVFP
jgi:hypothetical protein